MSRQPDNAAEPKRTILFPNFPPGGLDSLTLDDWDDGMPPKEDKSKSKSKAQGGDGGPAAERRDV